MDITALITPAASAGSGTAAPESQPTGVADFLAQYLGLVEEGGGIARPTEAETPDDAELRDAADAVVIQAIGAEPHDIPPKPASESTGGRIEAIIARWTGLTAAIDEAPASSNALPDMAMKGENAITAVPDIETVVRMTAPGKAMPELRSVVPATTDALEPSAGELNDDPPTGMTSIRENRPMQSTIAMNDFRTRDPTSSDDATEASATPIATPILTGNTVSISIKDDGTTVDVPLPDAGWQADIPTRHETPAPIATIRTPEARASAITRQIAQAAITLREGEIELVLAPEELGRLRLRVKQTEGSATVTVWFERPEVLEAARRHLDLLIRDLQDSGFESPSLDLHDQSAWSDPDDGGSEDNTSMEAVPSPANDESPRHLPLSDRPLDIRV